MKSMIPLLKRLPSELLLVTIVFWIACDYLFEDVTTATLVALVVILVLVAGLALLTYHLRLVPKTMRSIAIDVSGLQESGSWTRPMLKLPLDPDAIGEVFAILNNAQRKATSILHELGVDTVSTPVRTNLFLPTSDGVRDGDVCNLVIPHDEQFAKDGIQVNMENAKERFISFRPNQGATGRVYVEQKAIGVVTNPEWLAAPDDGKGTLVRWHQEIPVQVHDNEMLFNTSNIQDRRAVNDLAWIVSMPIKVGDETIGVFNVDCVKYQVTKDQLEKLLEELHPFASDIAGKLEQLPMQRIAILRYS